MNRIQTLAAKLWEAERPLRILSTIAWPPEVRERFLADGARELPVVSYERPDTRRSHELVTEVRRALTDDEIPEERWLRRQAESIGTAAEMLDGIGTPAFLDAGRRLYGTPAEPLADGMSTTLALAELFDQVLDQLTRVDLGAPPPACHLASGVADKMRRAVDEFFGPDAPEVTVVEHLSANALASPDSIRIRRTACFTDRDVDQLIQHEAFIHVATSLNGRSQSELPLLGAGHPGTTRTQEGLAVFAELISGNLDPDRLRRLADRVLGIQMAIEGADFLDVYRFFLERGLEAEQAFENSRRVFRGGVLTGGVPFTKDMVYLGGLLRVHNFLRAAVMLGRADCLRLLFCGKLDVEDVPALGRLAEQGLVKPPKYLPPWAKDLRFLVSYLSYSVFLNQIDLRRIRAHYEDLLQHTPVLGRR